MHSAIRYSANQFRTKMATNSINGLPKIQKLLFSTSTDQTPHVKTNYIANFAHTGQLTIIERFGKFQSVQEPGLYFAIPIINTLRVVDMRELVLNVQPQSGITKDNVRVSMSGVVYVQFEDAVKACYGARRPLYAATQQAQAVMRSGVGKMELDEILHNRHTLNELVEDNLNDAAKAWGLKVNRYEITDIVPDELIQQAMDLQAQAERKRRELVKGADASKSELILISEGERQKHINESEGYKSRLITEAQGYAEKMELEAKAQKTKIIAEAEGRAREIVVEAEARADAINKINDAINENENGMRAAEYDLARKYFEMMSQSINKGSTIFLPNNLGNFNEIVGYGTGIFKSMWNNDNKKEKE